MDQDMKYKAVLRHSEEGFSVSVPGLPGCWSRGATGQEAVENIRDAIVVTSRLPAEHALASVKCLPTLSSLPHGLLRQHPHY